jgi:hypothetical protein
MLQTAFQMHVIKDNKDLLKVAVKVVVEAVILVGDK